MTNYFLMTQFNVPAPFTNSNNRFKTCRADKWLGLHRELFVHFSCLVNVWLSKEWRPQKEFRSLFLHGDNECDGFERIGPFSSSKGLKIEFRREMLWRGAQGRQINGSTRRVSLSARLSQNSIGDMRLASDFWLICLYFTQSLWISIITLFILPTFIFTCKWFTLKCLLSGKVSLTCCAWPLGMREGAQPIGHMQMTHRLAVAMERLSVFRPQYTPFPGFYLL